ncbi:hypothetical protein [Vogesella sp. LIG4]|uniref:hypothetical protein n=1 Tax=Vogesella sp. LIG4 TaxID=1192162 RepID=UPI0008200F3C|nr:hypothetical protein [Vogesella sp. LIG4]SCK25811.1 hypothetical protein PSELUDRAFT_3088 [Vogesella sp. LIG4]
MTKLHALFLVAATLLPAMAAHADGGVIFFQGALVKPPCNANADVLAQVAGNPRAYQQARKLPSGPSCSGMDNTQFVSRAKVQGTDGISDLVTVAYN